MRWGRGDGRHGVHRSPASLLSPFLSEFIPYEVPYESQLPFETLSCLISLSTFHQSVSTNVPSSLMSPCVLPAHNPRHCQSRQRGSRYNFVLPRRANLPLPRWESTYFVQQYFQWKENTPCLTYRRCEAGQAIFGVLPFHRTEPLCSGRTTPAVTSHRSVSSGECNIGMDGAHRVHR